MKDGWREKERTLQVRKHLNTRAGRHVCERVISRTARTTLGVNEICPISHFDDANTFHVIFNALCLSLLSGEYWLSVSDLLFILRTTVLRPKRLLFLARQSSF